MADTGPTILGLCSGVGMLEAAVRLVFPGARTAALVEWESYAASVQLARMADASMEPAPIWCGDLGAFDARPFLGVVDILCAGLPCQPYSLAGKQQGNTDARSWGEDGNGPIPNFLRIVAECRPALVFLENVPAWVVGGWFRPVGEQLCRMGYELETPVFLAASDVGAAHQRERVFIVAHLPGERGQRWRLPAAGGRLDATDADGGGENVADTKCQRRCGRRTEWQDAEDAQAASRELGDIFAPGPCDRRWPGILSQHPHVAPAIEPGVCVLADGTSLVVDESRADQLRCTGNGVVALCAATALTAILRGMK